MTVPWTGRPLAVAIAPGAALDLQVPPRSLRVRLKGLLFDLDRTFLLPKSLPGVRRLGTFYRELPGAEVLVVGHTDTSGKAAYNLELSRQRAAVVAAYLRDDVPAWLGRYHERPGGVGDLWGNREDEHMLSALTDGEGVPFLGQGGDDSKDAATKAAVERFQAFSNEARGTALKVDGIAGDQTRTALIAAYMRKDEATFPADMVLVTHGCGESHPEVDAGDGVRLEANRRVEVFFFEDRIAPPAPQGDDHPCDEYPRWRDGAARTIDLRDDMPDVVAARWEKPLPAERKALVLRLLDRALNACPDLEATLVLPDGVRLFTRSDAQGLVRAQVPAAAGEVVVVYTPPAQAAGVRRTVRLALPPVSDDGGARRRLVHLGYPAEADPAGATRLFQEHQGLPATGALDAATRARLAELHDGGA